MLYLISDYFRLYKNKRKQPFVPVQFASRLSTTKPFFKLKMENSLYAIAVIYTTTACGGPENTNFVFLNATF